MDNQSSFSEYFIDINRPSATDEVSHALNTKGLVTFEKQFSREEFIEFSTQFGEVFHHRKSEEDGTDIITNIYEQDWYRKFTARAFEFHTDLSKYQIPPSLLCFYCQKSAEEGGESILLDGRELYKFLQSENPTLLKELSRPGSVIFGEDKILGSIYEKLQNGNIFMRYRYDNLVYFSPPILKVLPEFFEIMEKHTISFRLEANQGYLLNNGQWLHGRKAWIGERAALRLLLNRDNTLNGTDGLGFSVGLSSGMSSS